MILEKMGSKFIVASKSFQNKNFFCPIVGIAG